MDSYWTQAQSRRYSKEFSTNPDYRGQNSPADESRCKSRECSPSLNYRNQYSPRRNRQESNFHYHGQLAPKRTSQSYRHLTRREEVVHCYQCGIEGNFVQKQNVFNGKSMVVWPPFAGKPCIVQDVQGPVPITVETPVLVQVGVGLNPTIVTSG